MIKLLSILAFLSLFLGACGMQSEIIELQPSQSMSISGKGPGQDAAINPYLDGNSIAIVKNVGKNPLSYRIQRDGKVLLTNEISVKQKKFIDLEKGDELYFDSEKEAKAKVSFARVSNTQPN